MSDLMSHDVGDFTPQTSFVINRPVEQTVPLVFASPHSGRRYPARFLSQSCLDPLLLRSSEDAYVDELFNGVADMGAPFIQAEFPRVFIDVNREANELDSRMYDGAIPYAVCEDTPRVLAGIGTIARLVGNGQLVYDQKLPFEEIEHRLQNCYEPYHQALEELVVETHARFGMCLVVDCHSMPSVKTPKQRFVFRQPEAQADIVLGDCWGSSCDPTITSMAERTALMLGYSVRRNTPYAGGYTTQLYGQRDKGIHSIQLEIDRSLYMDERSLTKLPVFDEVQGRMMALASAMCERGVERLAAE